MIGGKVFTAGVLLFTAMTAATAQAQQVSNGGDPAAGKDKSAICQGCHGAEGIASNPLCPNLAGQFPKFIEKQINDFKAEKRADAMMSPMAVMITEKQDLADIAAYFATRKPMAAQTGDSALAAKGKDLFHNGNPATGLYACKNCHGDSGRGDALKNFIFPVIGGQIKDYIVKALKDFRSGGRHNDPAGMMGNIAKAMSDAEIDAVAEYVAGL